MTPATIRVRIEAIIRTRCTRAMSADAAAVILSEFELVPYPRPIERRMPNGRPCWCWSKDEPHEGWIHSPNCDTTLALWAEYQRDLMAERGRVAREAMAAVTP